MNDNQKIADWKVRCRKSREYLAIAERCKVYTRAELVLLGEFLPIWAVYSIFGWSITPSTVIAWLASCYLLDRFIGHMLRRMAVDVLTGKFTPTELRK